jgi:hypothetical protein
MNSRNLMTASRPTGRRYLIAPLAPRGCVVRHSKTSFAEVSFGSNCDTQPVRATSAPPPQSRHALTRLARQFRANKRRTAVQQFRLSASRLIQIFGVVARTL